MVFRIPDTYIDPEDFQKAPKFEQVSADSLPASFNVGINHAIVDVTTNEAIDGVSWLPSGLEKGALVTLTLVGSGSVTLPDTIELNQPGETATFIWTGDRLESIAVDDKDPDIDTLQESVSGGGELPNTAGTLFVSAGAYTLPTDAGDLSVLNLYAKENFTVDGMGVEEGESATFIYDRAAGEWVLAYAVPDYDTGEVLPADGTEGDIFGVVEDGYLISTFIYRDGEYERVGNDLIGYSNGAVTFAPDKIKVANIESTTILNSGNLAVGGETTTNSLDVAQDTSVGNNLSVNNNVNVSEKLTSKNSEVTETLDAKDVNVSNNVDVTETVTTKELVVENNATVNTKLDVNGNATVAETMTSRNSEATETTSAKNANISETISSKNVDVLETVSAKDVNISESLSVNGDVHVVGTTTLNNTLDVNSSAEISGDLSVTGDVSSASVTVAGDVTSNSGAHALSNKADKSNVLELDNTTVFTPDGEYEPATKKYVDDNAGKGEWGRITGNLQDQQDIQNALDNKANVADLATVATSGNYNDLTNTPDLSVYDEIEQHVNQSDFPSIGDASKFYLAKDTGVMYRWEGSGYVVISARLAIGETSSTAYRGDRGASAYNHSLVTNGNPHNVTKTDVGLGNADNTSDIDKPISSSTQNALDGKSATTHNHNLNDLSEKSYNSLTDKPTTITIEQADAITANTAKRTYPQTDEDKLSAIEENATKNDTDANLKNRENHTGTQTASTISDFDAKVSNNTTVLGKVDKVISTDNAIVRFDGVTGELQDSGLLITDDGNLDGNGKSIHSITDLAIEAAAGQSTPVFKAVKEDGNVALQIDANGDIRGTRGYDTNFIARYKQSYLFTSGEPSSTPISVKAHESQSIYNPITEWLNSNNERLLGVNNDGELIGGVNGLVARAPHGSSTIFTAGGSQYTPTVTIKPNNTSTGAVGLLIKGSSGQTANLQELKNSDDIKLLIIDASGNMGIGIDTPQDKLEVNGKIKATSINFSGLPTSSTGLVSGDVWNDGGTLKIIP